MNSSITKHRVYEQDNRREWSMRETARLLGISTEELYRHCQAMTPEQLARYFSQQPMHPLKRAEPDFTALRPTRRRYWWSRLQRWFRGE